MQLILGSAGFCKAYGEGVGSPPTVSEVILMLRIAREAGIEWIDTSPSYGCEHILKSYAKEFHIINKSRDMNLWGNKLLYHYQPGEPLMESTIYNGGSVYEQHQITGLEEYLEIPYNIWDIDFEPYLYLKRPKIIVRSVFARGQLLKTRTIKECLDFVKKWDRIYGVVIGPQSVKELEGILNVW